MSTTNVLKATTVEKTVVRDVPGGNQIGMLNAGVNVVGNMEGGNNNNWIRIFDPQTGWVNKSSLTNIRWETVTVPDPTPSAPSSSPSASPSPSLPDDTVDWSGLSITASQVIETTTAIHTYEGTLAWKKSEPK